MQKLTDFVLGWFYTLKSLVLVIATEAGPILSTLIPALFAAQSLQHTWPWLSDWKYLIIVGMWLVGLATVKGALSSYIYNRDAVTEKGNLRKGYNSLAPFWLWLSVAVAYYAIELLVVVILEIANVISRSGFAMESGWANLLYVTAPAAFVLLSAIANVVLALADDQAKREGVSFGFRGAVQNSVQADVQETVQAGQVSKDDIMAGIVDYLASNPQASVREVGRAVDAPKSTVANYMNELQNRGAIHKNGKGWEIIY